MDCSICFRSLCSCARPRDQSSSVILLRQTLSGCPEASGRRRGRSRRRWCRRRMRRVSRARCGASLICFVILSTSTTPSRFRRRPATSTCYSRTREAFINRCSARIAFLSGWLPPTTAARSGQSCSTWAADEPGHESSNPRQAWQPALVHFACC